MRKLITWIISLLISFILISAIYGAPKKKVPEPSKTENKVMKAKTAEDKKKKPSTADKKEKNKASKMDPAEEQKKRDEKNTKKIKEVIAYGIHDERKEAVNRILTIKDAALKKELIDLLFEIIPKEFNAEVKVKALTVLGELKPKRGEKVLAPLIKDASEEVRIAAVYTIKNNELKSLKDELIKELKKQDLETDNRFIEALIVTLGDFKAEELADFAREAVSKTGTASTIRERFVLFFGKLKNTKSNDFLLKLYKDDEEELTIRSYAVNSLAHLGAKEAIEPIKKILKDIDTYSFKKKKRFFSLSMYSVAALVKLGDDSAVPRLMDSLKSQNPRVRIKAIDLLKELKDKRTIDILKYKMKYDPSPKVQNAAKAALKEMGIEVEEDKEENKKAKNKNDIKKNDKKSNSKKP